MNRFENSSFHRENQLNKPKPKTKSKPKPKTSFFAPTPKDAKSDFFKELAETGRPNWKIAPSAVKSRYNGLYMIIASIPILIVTSIEMYRRLEGKSVKRVQEGEILENGEVRKFSEAEKYKVERESWSHKLFGRDFFLDGFTSKTMRKDLETKGQEAPDKEGRK